MAAIDSLSRLAQHFDPNLNADDIEDILDAQTTTNATDADADDVLKQFRCVQNARKHPAVRNDLRELLNDCHNLTSSALRPPTPETPHRKRSLSTNSSASQLTTPSAAAAADGLRTGWSDINRDGNINTEQLLAYFTCLVHLAQQRPNDSVDRKLGLLAARSYVLLCTLPGAQMFGVFRPELLRRVFAQFGLLAKLLRKDRGPTLREHEQIDLLMDCISLQTELLQMLSVVSLAEHADLKKALVRMLNAVFVHYFELVHRSKCMRIAILIVCTVI